MRRWTTAVFILAAVVVLGGCAIKEIPYDRETAGGIQRIGLVTPRLPSRAMVNLANSPAKGFGAIGHIIHASVQGDREARFDVALQAKNFSAEDALVRSFTAALEAHGYAVSLVPARRDKGDFLQAYPTDRGDKVDAYLDIVAQNYGYLAMDVGSDSPWRPSYQLRVRLVRASDASVLMQDTIIYNPVGQPKKVVTVAPDPSHFYDNFEALERDPDGAIKGMREAFDQGAKALGTLLK